MLYSEEYVNEEISIARNAIAEAGLYRTNITGELKYELYCIPSHNHYCYYVQILCSQDKNHMIYARTEIDDFICGKILMYPFSDAVNRNNRQYGKIVCGMREISSTFKENLIQAFEIVPDKREWQEHSLIIIDGVFQMIRMYENNSIIKEFAYFHCENDFLNDFYEVVEAEIKG